jgi:uncharacterized protein (TIGR02231 family)
MQMAPSYGGGGMQKESSVLFSLGSLMEMDAGMPAAPPPPIEPSDAWLDFDALVLSDPGDKRYRGRLRRSAEDASRLEAAQARDRIERIEAPSRTVDPLEGRGRFDYRYNSEGRSDVPSNGRPHRVHVKSAEGPASARFRAVPRERPEVYRETHIENPFGAPLLGGPVDVFLDGALITSTEIGAVDRGGMLLLGLGVEDRLRVARNARVEESSAGLLGGSTVVDHHVTVDITSSLGVPVAVEILERVPVTDDKDISIKRTAADPEPEAYDQADIGSPVRGGLRFRADVAAGGKAKVTYSYRVKLPAKNEIVGGNRRE